MTDLEANTGKRGILWALIQLLLHPGYLAVRLFRLSAWLRSLPFLGPLLARCVWRINVLLTGCHISPHASIGPGLRLPHASAIVIGEGARIGAHVTLYQNVTRGRRHPDIPRYPVLHDNVIVYCGASLLGAVVVDQGTSVPAHSVIMEST